MVQPCIRYGNQCQVMLHYEIVLPFWKSEFIVHMLQICSHTLTELKGILYYFQDLSYIISKSNEKGLCVEKELPNRMQTLYDYNNVDLNNHTHICCFEHPIPEFSALSAVYTLLGNLSTRFWSVAIRIFVYSATRALMMSDTDNG